MSALLIAILALLTHVGSAQVHAVAYEDGSSVHTIEWTAPQCPDRADEPCYIALVTDAETGEVRITAGP